MRDSIRGGAAINDLRGMTALAQKVRMDRFVAIAEGLDVAPALAELERAPEYWVSLNMDAQDYVPLLGSANARLLQQELPAVWGLIDRVHARAVADHGDAGRLSYARVGRMPPGFSLFEHRDEVDGVNLRRYHIALQSRPGATMTIEGEVRGYAPGEAWWVDAGRMHSVANDSDADRILILFDTQA